MRPGTPGFSPHRLKAARQARGLTGAALAELVSISRSAISQYERGIQTPSPKVVQEIADKLNLPAHYFVTPKESGGQTAVFYRSFSAALKSSRTRLERKLEWLHEIVFEIESLIEFPKVNLPSFDLPSDVLNLTDDKIEELAKQTRRFWNLGDGPISNLVLLLENNGIVISRQFLDSMKLDAFSNWNEKTARPIVVLGTDKGAAVRSRFDAAHELAHLLLHSKFDEKDLKNAARFKQIERQADRFAGAFILPATTFLSEVVSFSPEALLGLKKRWGASVGLMAKRSSDLGAIFEEEATRLWMKISRRGWRKKEPYDDTIEPEEPKLLEKSFRVLIESNTGARDALMAKLPWYWRDVEELSSLPSGLLAPTGSKKENFSPRIIKFPQTG